MKKGISLVALVITIIVLIILTGAVILNIGGENSIIERAKTAVEESNKANIREEVIVEISDIKLKAESEGKDIIQYMTDNEELERNLAAKGISYSLNSGIIFTKDGYTIQFDEKGRMIRDIQEIGETGEVEVQAWDGTISVDVAPQENNSNLYYISNAEELAWLSQEVNSGNTFSGKTIELTNNIDLNNNQWTPIGGVVEGMPVLFSGTFDGKGHTITNINISSSDTVVGILGAVGDATIKNLGIIDGQIACSTNSVGGGIVGGTMGTVIIENCFNKNTNVNGSDSLAGILGICVGGETTIQNCYNVCSSNNGKFSGILSQCMDAFEQGITPIVNISNCYNVGTLVNEINGICKWANDYDGEVNITNCYTKGESDDITVDAGITTKTSGTMKSSGFVTTLGSAYKSDANNINNGYPILNWQ